MHLSVEIVLVWCEAIQETDYEAERTELGRARHNLAHSAECGQLKLPQHQRATEDVMGHLASSPGIMESLLIFSVVRLFQFRDCIQDE